MSNHDDKLIRMANQIATFFDSQPSVDPAKATAVHLNDFWTVEMRARLLELIEADAPDMRPTVRSSGPHVRRPGQAPRDQDHPAGIPPTRLDDEGRPRDPGFATSGGGSDAG